MLSLESRRFIKSSAAQYDAQVDAIRQALVTKPTDFWDAILFTLDEYRKLIHEAWLTNTILKTAVTEMGVDFSISSNLISQASPKKVVEFQFRHLAVPHLVKPITIDTMERVKVEITTAANNNSQPMTLFWWAGIKWLFDSSWTVIAYNFNPETRMAVSQFLSPCKMKTILITADYAVVLEDHNWLSTQ